MNVLYIIYAWTTLQHSYFNEAQYELGVGTTHIYMYSYLEDNNHNVIPNVSLPLYLQKVTG